MRGASRASLAAALERLDAVATDRDAAGLESVSESLLSVVRLLADHATLRRSLSDPSLPADAKQGLVDRLLAERIDATALDLLHTVVRSRWSQPVDLVDAVEELAVQSAFTIAESQGRLDDIEDELFRFARIIDRDRELRAALTSHTLPERNKRDLLQALLEDKVAPATLRFVENVVLAPRGRVVDRAIENLAALAARRRQRLIAQVRVAVPLSPEQRGRLATELSETFGHQIDLQVEVDPAVIGGVVVRVGDEIIDGTLTHRLTEARRRLAG